MTQTTIRRVRRVSLLKSSRQAALAAIHAYNNPLMTFKTETFVVLMMMAWTYLLHAHYRRIGVEYRYHTKIGDRRRFARSEGRYRYWELAKCLDARECPLDADTKNNLRFLIGLRNEVEHVKPPQLDSYLSGRYQACVLNYNHYVQSLFGGKSALDEYLPYSLQFSELRYQQSEALTRAEEGIPPRVRSYVAAFDESLTDEEINSDRYSYRLLFLKMTANRRGQADRVIEFIPPESELAQSISKEYWVIKEKEKDKYRPKDVITFVREQGFPSFGMGHHIRLWQAQEAKDEAKGYGVWICGQWYWYQKWVDFVLDYQRSYAPEAGE